MSRKDSKKTKVSPDKHNLASVVRRELVQSGVSQDEFAISNLIDHDAFRTQLARNTYSKHVLRVITSILGCELEKLSDYYVFNQMRSLIAGAISPLEAIKRRIRRSIKISPDNKNILPL